MTCDAGNREAHGGGNTQIDPWLRPFLSRGQGLVDRLRDRRSRCLNSGAFAVGPRGDSGGRIDIQRESNGRRSSTVPGDPVFGGGAPLFGQSWTPEDRILGIDM
jgi:hypothetical protein